MQKLDATSFNHFLATSYTRPVLVKFGTTWCGPCKSLVPLLEKITDVPVGDVDAEESPDIAGHYMIASYPTLLKFERGQVVARHIGNPGSVAGIRQVMGI